MTLHRAATPWGAASIGLRPLHLTDGPAGVRAKSGGASRSLLTPCQLALAASWDPGLLRRVGEVVGDEARRHGAHAIFAPNVNLVRGPLGGRNFEQYSEDPWLSGVLAASWIQGLQSRRVAAVVKHMACNDSETDRQTMNAVVGERVLRETYLLPFQMAVEAGAWGVMMAYNRVNGTYCSEHPFLINQILKSEWQFDGIVISDAGGTRSTVPSALAGLDLELPGPGRPQRFGEPLAQAVRDGLVDESVLDAAVDRLLLLAERVGELGDGPLPTPKPLANPREVLREAAAAGFVLLKNEGGLLPILPGSIRSLAVIGPNATSPCFQGGAFSQLPLPDDVATPLSSIVARYGAATRVRYELGARSAPKVPPLSELNIMASDGTTPGVTLEYYLEGRTEPVGRETRTGGSMVWMPVPGWEMPGVGGANQRGRVHLTGTLVPEVSAVHTFYVGSSSAFTLLVDGRELIRQGERSPIDDMGALMRPHVLTADLPLRAGVPVRVEVDMRFGPSRAHSLHLGCRAPEPDDLLARAVEVASASDAVVLVVGETQDNALESADRTTTRLPGRQVELIERVCTANPSTVVVVNVAHAIGMSWVDRAAAVLLTWFPGQEFGPALAAVLSGEAEPGGRLPITIARRDQDYQVFDLTPVDGDLVYEAEPTLGYRHFDLRGIEPRFGFGHGLGYATFAYESMHIEVGPDPSTVEVAVVVRNLSDRAGKEVVQLYLRGPEQLVPNPLQLRGWAVLQVEARGTAVARLRLDRRSFSRWSSRTKAWEVLPGTYQICVGRSVTDIRLSDVIALSG
ncbi:MAG TPA: glycoside hydrolase family 3 C-terminal domain-containing protein [Candidatus Dormibacteraeota bacterium]|nr:glycoside hydrolase family 3 C-terminal domain-containing protein [Candidatus Dormibacteraeota bacterium]